MTLTVVVGGQFGSEGKGAIAGAIAHQNIPWSGQKIAVRVAGPNAGHTVYDFKGNKFAFRQLPVAAVVDHEVQLVLAAGSEIDPPVLAAEIELAESHGHPIRGRLFVDYQATVIELKHKDAEASAELVGKIGSTGKGIGAARADRIMRNAKTFGQWIGLSLASPDLDALREYVTDNTAATLNRALTEGADVLIEGTQGYGLGLHGAYYPQATSSDCRAVDFCAMAGISPWVADRVRVVVVARSFPIRVAGNSGPLRAETTWEKLGLEPEKTTVTQKIRRVGLFDMDLLVGAVLANGGWSQGGRSSVEVAWTMADQRVSEIAGWSGVHTLDDLPALARETVLEIEAETKATVTMIGTSPTTVVLL